MKSFKHQTDLPRTTIQQQYTALSKNVDDKHVLSFISRFNTADDLIPKPPIKYPVFQGGGAKGNAYAGAYCALDEQGYLDEIACPGGASAGGIVAFFMALGFDGKQFTYASEKLNFLDFTDLKKDGWGSYLDGHKVGIALDLFQQGGAYSGENFHNWASHFVEQILGNKDATFKDLHDLKSVDPTLKDLLLVATHYGTSSHAQQVFSFETTPHVVLADALRATMSFPGAFTPWEVREKVGENRSKPIYKSLGFFADGGILNNFPIDNFNSKQYRDQEYDFIERVTQNGKPVQVNPCVLGFSLTNLDELDHEITPFTDKIKSAKNKDLTAALAQPRTQKQGWHYSDLAKAALWNTFGKPEVEDVHEKQKIYFDQTVQIWPEDIGTLEFDLPKEKLSRLVDNGKKATQLWLDKNRASADVYNYTDDYHCAISKEDKKLKQVNPKAYFERLLKIYFDSLVQEMEKMKKQGKHNDADLALNVKLGFISNNINKIIDQTKELNISLSSIFSQAYAEYQAKQKQMENHRSKRWALLVPEKVVDQICTKMNKQPKVALNMLKNQLSASISLSQVDHGRLLERIVKTNNVAFATKALGIIQDAIKQQYYLGKIANQHNLMKQLLNANPSILSVGIVDDNIEMISLLLSLGMDASLVDSKTKTSPLEEAIKAGKYELFKFILTDSAKQDGRANLQNLNTLMHKVFENGSSQFINQVSKDESLFRLIINSTKNSAGKNVFHHLAQAGSANAFCMLAFEQIDNGTHMLLVEKDANRNSPLSYLLQHNRSDVIKELIKQGKGRNKGYLWNSDYHLDDIFQLGTHRENYKAIVAASEANPSLVKLIVDNIADQELKNKIRNEIALNSKQLVDQPVIAELEAIKVHQKGVLFHRLSHMPRPINDEVVKSDKTGILTAGL